MEANGRRISATMEDDRQPPCRLDPSATLQSKGVEDTGKQLGIYSPIARIGRR